MNVTLSQSSLIMYTTNFTLCGSVVRLWLKFISVAAALKGLFTKHHIFQWSGRRGFINMRLPPQARGSRRSHRHLLPPHSFSATVRRVRPCVHSGRGEVWIPGHSGGRRAFSEGTATAMPENL